MGTISGFLCILLAKTRKIVMHVYIQWFSMHVTGENTVNSKTCVYLVVFHAFYW